MDVLVVNVGSSSTDLSLVVDHDVRTVNVPTDELTDVDPVERVVGNQQPSAVGHRIVHGGRHTEHVVIDDQVRADLDQAVPLAPLHLPPALHAVDHLRQAFPDVPHVACFDTAFHRELPLAARTYAVPAEWRERWGLRRYGFHGLSYAWASRRAAALLRRPVHELQLVLAHMGGGTSVCAVRDGRSADTSMGLTPLEGTVMTTRSGSVDPGLLLWLLQGGHLAADQVADALWRQSGLVALSGRTHTHDLVDARRRGDQESALALAVFSRSIRHAIAAAATALERLDAVVFTGEIGADEPEVRADVCAGLATLGLAQDLEPIVNQDAVVGDDGVPVVTVVPQEHREIAAETVHVLQRRR